MNSAPPPPQSVSWNGLTLGLPPGWETIIGGKRHLIFENNLRPALEIRWESGQGRTPSKRQRDRILSQLPTESISASTMVSAPEYLALSGSTFDLQTIATPSSTDGALLTCRRCGTLVLARFHSTVRERGDYRKFFTGLECQHQDGSAANWSIQDISFMVPEGYVLERYHVSFGLSTFSFAGRHSQLHLCRLAPASEHLKQSSLAELFRIFSKTETAEHIAEDPGGLKASHEPSLIERLTARLRRQHPFRQARFRHAVEYDRILGFRLESYRPIQADAVRMLQEHYGLVQEKN